MDTAAPNVAKQLQDSVTGKKQNKTKQYQALSVTNGNNPDLLTAPPSPNIPTDEFHRSTDLAI